MVLPQNPAAMWWSMMKFMRVVCVIPPDMTGMQCLTTGGWVDRTPPYPVMLCVFPVMPKMQVLKARIGTIMPRPTTRRATVKGEKRGTWVVLIMSRGERVMQELHYPEVEQEVWLCQVHGPQPADHSKLSYRLWSKSLAGGTPDPMKFLMVKGDDKRHWQAPVEDCYWVTPWVDDSSDTRTRSVFFDHRSWFQAWSSRREEGPLTPEPSTPILAAVPEVRELEVRVRGGGTRI